MFRLLVYSIAWLLSIGLGALALSIGNPFVVAELGALDWILLLLANSRRRRSLPRPAELVLGAWVIVVWLAPVPGHFVPGAWGALLGLGSAAIALWEGEPALRPRAGPRWTIIALILMVHWRILAAVHDGIISDILVNTWGNLEVWLFLMAFFSLAVVSVILLSLDLVWRSALMNRLAIAMLSRRTARDPLWTRLLELRHRFHSIPFDRFKPALIPFEYALGARPKWIYSPAIPNRVEQYLRGRLVKASRDVDEHTYKWRAARMCNRSQSGEPVIRALDQRRCALLALGDYLFCPHVPCTQNSRSTREGVRDLAFTIDAHLHEVAVFDALIGRSTPAADTQPLAERLRNHNQTLVREAPELETLIELRRAIRDGDARQDLGRIQLRHRVLDLVRTSQAFIYLVLDGLLAEYRVAQDWQGLIETCRQIGLAGIVLSLDGHLELGEACYWYAYEIHPRAESPLSEWAFDQAASHFFEAGAAEHLACLSSTAREEKSHVA